MTDREKELKQTFNFYKDCSEGFMTPDGYAAVPMGKQFMVVYEGQQLKKCRSETSSMRFIRKHRKQWSKI